MRKIAQNNHTFVNFSPLGTLNVISFQITYSYRELSFFVCVNRPLTGVQTPGQGRILRPEPRAQGR